MGCDGSPDPQFEVSLDVSTKGIVKRKIKKKREIGRK